MNEQKNGGPAFPINDAAMVHTVAAAAVEGVTDSAERDRIYIEASRRAASGMTLRDYFAVHSNLGDEIPVRLAMSLMNGAPPDYTDDPVANSIYWAEVRARLRYIDADAMIRARGEA